jgi:hypothetical protein
MNVFNSEQLSKKDSINLCLKNLDNLCLTKNAGEVGGKRFLVLISVKDFAQIEQFKIDRSEYGNMDDWLPVEDINKVRADHV